MPIDVHAHYVPSTVTETLAREGSRFGIALFETAPACHAIRFPYGVSLRPFFAKLTEDPKQRLASMDATGIDRQLLSTWCDVFGYGLERAQGTAWHRVLNETLAAFVQRHPDRFAFLASVYLPDAASARCHSTICGRRPSRSTRRSSFTRHSRTRPRARNATR